MQITRNHVSCHAGPFRMTRPIHISSQSCSQNVVSSGKTVDLSLKSADSGILTLGSIFSSQSAFIFLFYFFFILFFSA